jgi:hypothetical protein
MQGKERFSAPGTASLLILRFSAGTTSRIMKNLLHLRPRLLPRQRNLHSVRLA